MLGLMQFEKEEGDGFVGVVTEKEEKRQRWSFAGRVMEVVMRGGGHGRGGRENGVERWRRDW